MRDADVAEDGKERDEDRGWRCFPAMAERERERGVSSVSFLANGVSSVLKRVEDNADGALTYAGSPSLSTGTRWNRIRIRIRVSLESQNRFRSHLVGHVCWT